MRWALPRANSLGNTNLNNPISQMADPSKEIIKAAKRGQVLRHVFPQADIPVVQLSIDETQPPEFRYEIGQRLAPLRDEGVLVIGSGNIVHNLHTYAWGRHEVEPFDWAVRFEEQAREFLLEGNHAPLIDYEALGRDAILSAPTPDHYLPLLYVIALRREGEQVTFPVEGFDGGSISMLTVQIG